MPEINGTLNTVLGFVTIVLVLSLIIQSLQNIIKRLLSMKSKQAEQSLRLLFDYVLTEDPSKYTGLKYASPILRAATKLPGGEQGIAESVVQAVKDEVLEVGRKSFWGNALLDSVTKEDLIKILNKLSMEPVVEEKEAEVVKEAKKVKDAIDGKVDEIETWYDTVMPGLAERYERGMKWMAVALSVLVVIVFNANAITIYKYVASDSAVQKQLIDYGESRKKDSAPPQDPEHLKTDINEIKGLVSAYANLGLTPSKSVTDVWNNLKDWRANLLGWLAMTLLLSLGAPFWEDALESLFGLKNTLRGKGKEQQKNQL